MSKYNQKRISFCLAFVLLLMPFLYLGNVYAADEDFQEIEVIESSETRVNELPDIKENSVQYNSKINSNGIFDELKFLTYLVVFGKAIQGTVWNVVKSKVSKLYGKYVDITVQGPYKNKTEGNLTIFGLKSKKNGDVFRLDMKVLKDPQDRNYYLWFQYHIEPKMSTHYDVAKIKWGKNQPPSWWW